MTNILNNSSDTMRWPASHKIFIEVCEFAPEGVKVLFTSYKDRDNVEANWIYALIADADLKAFTLEVLKETCTDKSCPKSGEHVQVSTHITPALVEIQILEFMETYAQLYIEDAKPFKVLPIQSIQPTI